MAEPTQAIEPAKPKGNSSIRTPANAAVILRALKIGLNPQRAAEVAGLSKPTFYRWRDDDPEFDVACRTAVAEGVADVVTALINQVHRGNIAAICFWLKTRTSEFRESGIVSPDDEGQEEVETRYL